MSNDARDRLELLRGGGLQPAGLVSMVRDGQIVIGESEMPGSGRLEMEATAVRRERSGIHARLSIAFGGQTAAYSILNVERDEDRTRLANSAAKRIGGDKRGEAIKVRLDQFCQELWGTWVRTDEGEEIPLSNAAPPKWLLEPYILQGGGTILFAPPGTAKSWTALIWAACLANDGGSGPFSCDPARVLYVDLERGSSSLEFRLASIHRATGLRPRVLGQSRRGMKFADVFDSVRSTVIRRKVDLVVLDSLSRAGYGNLNDNDDTNAAMDALNALGCAWLALGHSPRADATHVFGSVMHDAAADICVRMQSSYAPGDQQRMGVKFEVTKANDVRRAAAAFFEYGFGTDEEGLVSVGRASANDFPDLCGSGTVADQVADYLQEGRASATEIANELGVDRSAVSQALRRDTRFVKLDREGKTVFYGLAVTGIA